MKNRVLTAGVCHGENMRTLILRYRIVYLISKASSQESMEKGPVI